MKVPEPPPPPRRYTSPTGRVLIPVLLLVLLIVVLGRPILISGLNLDQEEDDPRPVPTSTADGNGDGHRGPTRLAGKYPKACLRPSAASGLGLIAASDGGTVTVRTPTGGAAFVLRANAPIGWSPSGTFLATAGADLWTNQGNPIGVAFSRPVDVWAWSPIADCLVGVEGNRLVVVQPRERAEFLLRGMKVDTFSFSPDGKSLVVAVGDGRDSGIWLADLRSGKLERMSKSLDWTLLAWSPGGAPFLIRSPGRAGGLDFPPSDEFAYCGDGIVAVRDGNLVQLALAVRDDASGARRVRGTFTPIGTEGSAVYRGVACSPTGQLLVAVRGATDQGPTTMAVLRRDGAMVEEVAQGSDVEDHPMWGPGGTGVVFVGTVGGEGAAGPLVWFLPEGGSAQTTGLRIGDIDTNLDARLDWSATPPLGHPNQ